MSDDSSRPSTAKEKWKDKEAKRLKNTVLGHLAYYIQVRIPEETYDNDTFTVSKCAINETSKAQGKKKVNTKKIFPVSGRKNGKSRNMKHNRDMSSNDVNGSYTENDCSKEKANPKKNRKKKKRRFKSFKPSENGVKDNFFRQFNRSPYTVDLLDPIVDRRKSAVLKREESERIAANAAHLLKTLPLADVVEIHKYHSISKSQLPCSSSLSGHPSGMLHSCKAVKYLTDNDDRISARKYMIKKKAKLRKEAKNKKINKLTSSISTSSTSGDDDEGSSVRDAPIPMETMEGSTYDLDEDVANNTSEEYDSSSSESEKDENETETSDDNDVLKPDKARFKTSSDETGQEESADETDRSETEEETAEYQTEEKLTLSDIKDLRQDAIKDLRQDASSVTDDKPSSSDSEETSSLDSSIAKILQEAKLSSRSSFSSSSDDETKNSTSKPELSLRKLEDSQPLGYLNVTSGAKSKTGEPITESGGEKLDVVRILD